MDRRSLIQSILTLPIFSWLTTPKPAHVTRQEGAIAGLRAHYGTKPKGLRARRQEILDLFTKSLDSCIDAEENYGAPYDAGPEDIRMSLSIRYPGKGFINSDPVLRWVPSSQRPEWDEVLREVAFKDFIIPGRDGQPDRRITRGSKLGWDFKSNSLIIGEEKFYAPEFREIRENPDRLVRPSIFWPEREYVEVTSGVHQVQFKKERA